MCLEAFSFCFTGGVQNGVVFWELNWQSDYDRLIVTVIINLHTNPSIQLNILKHNKIILSKQIIIKNILSIAWGLTYEEFWCVSYYLAVLWRIGQLVSGCECLSSSFCERHTGTHITWHGRMGAVCWEALKAACSRGWFSMQLWKGDYKEAQELRNLCYAVQSMHDGECK